MDTFDLLSDIRGYVNKGDVTQTPMMYLVSGSQNMLVVKGNEKDAGTKVVSRAGYELYGDANAALTPVKSSTTWKHNQGVDHFLREYNGTLELRLTVDETGATVDPYFATLLTGLSTTKPVRFVPVWNATELIDVLLFVNNSSILYEWSGGYGTYASSTSNTLTINETIAESHFLTSGTRQIRVLDSSGNWQTFTYTSQSGSEFTLSVGDPTLYTFNAGAPVVQVVRTNSNTPASGFTNDYIDVLENQVFVGSDTSRRVYVSKATSYTDFTFSSPRVPTEGALLTLDDVTRGFKVGTSGEGLEAMHIFSGNDRAYRVEFRLNAGDTADRELLKIKPIINAPNQGAFSQEMIGKTKNFIVFLNNNNELVELGSIESQVVLTNTPISDDIQADFIVATFTNGQIFFDTNSLYVTAPTDSKMWIFDLKHRWWHSPQILPVRRMDNYAGDLYGHSNAVPETYKLFTGTDDNGLPITFNATYAYRAHNRRDALKHITHYFTEMYVTSNAEVTHKVLFEYGGAKGIQTYTYKGDETDHLFTANPLASLGQNSLGTNPLGGYLEEPDDLIKYRRIRPLVPVDYFEYQVSYECETQDAQMQILSHGGNAMLSKNYPVKIKK